MWAECMSISILNPDTRVLLLDPLDNVDLSSMFSVFHRPRHAYWLIFLEFTFQ